MRRSEIDRYIKEAYVFLEKMYFRLPSWACFNACEWDNLGPEYKGIAKNMLGWEVTDFGSGKFKDVGVVSFTMRNHSTDEGFRTGNYAEKVIIVRKNQVTPAHYHKKKTEDVINRGGGKLCVKLWMADAKGGMAENSFSAEIDGISRKVIPGEILKINPGESICITPGMYHTFWAEIDMVMAGQISSAEIDHQDTFFYENYKWETDIEEDEQPDYFLSHEYPEFTK